MPPKFLSQHEIEKLTRDRFPEFGDSAIEMDVIDRDGSGRCFYRLKNRSDAPLSIMAMNYTLDRPENGRFVEITRFLQSLNIHVPAIRAETTEPNVLWVEDLGNRHLIDDFTNNDWPAARPVYQSALRTAARLHTIVEADAPNQLPELEHGFDEPLYRWEQDYFFENFVAHFCQNLDPSLIDQIRKNDELRDIRETLAAAPRALIHRDFQSTNVMVRPEGETWMIDYQGMRWGVPEYDVASLIYDPYVALTKTNRNELAQFYFEMRQSTEPFSTFEKRLNFAAAQRLMQALGAYGNLGLNIGKTEFLNHIPAGIARLQEVVQRGVAPSLTPILDAATRD